MPHFHLPNPFRSNKPHPPSSHKRSQSQPRAFPSSPPPGPLADPSPACCSLSSPTSPTSSLDSDQSGTATHSLSPGRRIKLLRGGGKRDSFGCLDANRLATEEGERRRRELRSKRSEAGLFRRAKGGGHERGGSIPVVKDFAFDVHLPPPHAPFLQSTYTPPPSTPAPTPAVSLLQHPRHQRSTSTPGRRPTTAPSTVDLRRMPKSRSAEERMAAEARTMEVLDDRAWRRTGCRWD